MASDEYVALVQGMAKQVDAAQNIALPDGLSKDINKIAILGVGGSAIVGDILHAFLYRSKFPVIVSRSYSVPEFIDTKTLVFAISYSGNTEETLTAVRKAIAKGAQVVAVTSGGKLAQQFAAANRPIIRMPSGMQPRASLASQLIPLLRVLAQLGMIPDVSADIKSAIVTLTSLMGTYEERASTLAQKLIGKVPLIYASDRYSPVAYRWKTQFNEHAKIHAFSAAFSELNHNEMVGYEKINANYHVIMLEDEDDNRRIKARMKLTRDIIAKRGVPATQIRITGENLLTRLLSAIYLGDLTSVKLALATGIDPEPVDIIESFKKDLEKVPNI